MADLGREPVRGVRADRGSGRADQRPARAIPARAMSARSRRAGNCASPRRRAADSRRLRVRGVSRPARGHARRARRGRLAAHRRHRRMARRAAAPARPRARLHRHRRRQDAVASYIENILRASPYVAEVAVFGHARKYLTALIEIDYDTVADWARSERRRVHRLHQPRVATPRSSADPERARARERAARASRADQGVPHPAEGARPGGGGRADHADAQGEAPADVRALPGPRRVRCTATPRRGCSHEGRATYCDA